MAEQKKVDSATADQQTRFVFDLLGQLYQADHNLVLSPYLAISAFCMVLSGADGETKKQMMKTLFGVGLDSGDSHLEQFIQRNQSLMSKNADSLLISNMMYVDQKYPLHKEYLDILTAKFNSIAKTLDFIKDPSGTVKVINSDAEKATKGLIKQVVTAADIDALTRLFLVNAVYFKGIWKSQFRNDLFYVKEKQPFRTSSGKLLHTSFFCQSFTAFPYYHNDEWHIKALRLDYQPSANGGQTAMVFLMPDHEDISIQSFIQSQLTPAKFDHILHDLQSINSYGKYVSFKIPRFKFTNSLNLVQPMANLGITDLFKLDTANLHKISPMASVEGLNVADCIQKVVIDVNEKGTEAAALTFARLRGGCSSYEPPEIVKFTANRPFVFALIALGVQIEVLFVGVVEDPTKDE